MKIRNKQFIVSMFALFLLAILLRGILWRTVSSYEDIKQLQLQTLTNKMLKEKIKTETRAMDGNEIIVYCRKLTADCLTFSMSHAENDINKMYPKNKAHCVGYAAFFATACQYAFRVFNQRPLRPHKRIDTYSWNEYPCAVS